MAHSLLNSSPILRGTVTLPRQGVWHADLVLDGDSAPSGPVTLSLGPSLQLRGVARGGVFAGEVRVRVEGGAGKLRVELLPKWYEGAPREIPLRDLCEEAGEQLASTTDPALLDEVLSPGWTRLRGTAAEALARLLEGTGASWRLLPDGKLWAGPETWPTAQGMADLVILEEDRTRGRVVLATEAPTLLPGQTLRGDRVSDVEITIEPERLRVEAWLERSTPGVLDRFKGALIALIEFLVLRRTRYLGSYWGTVVATDASGRVEVKMDDEARPPVTAVSLRAGTPGTELQVVNGCRVLVSWEGGDPRRPVAQPWDEGGLKEVRITASVKATINAPQVVLDEAGLPVARQGDLVTCGGPLMLVSFGPPVGTPPLPMSTSTLYPVTWTQLDPNNPLASGVPMPFLAGTIMVGNPKVKG